MALSRERLELALTQVAAMVEPDHIAPEGPGDHGDCIVGAVIHMLGMVPQKHLEKMRGLHENQVRYAPSLRGLVMHGVLGTQDAVDLARDAMHMNDSGRTWHEIVQHLVTDRVAAAGAEPEPAAVSEPEALPTLEQASAWRPSTLGPWVVGESAPQSAKSSLDLKNDLAAAWGRMIQTAGG